MAAPTQGGLANRAVAELLRGWLGVRDVEIVSGHSSSEKTVRVQGLEALDERQLEAAAGPAKRPG